MNEFEAPRLPASSPSADAPRAEVSLLASPDEDRSVTEGIRPLTWHGADRRASDTVPIDPPDPVDPPPEVPPPLDLLADRPVADVATPGLLEDPVTSGLLDDPVTQGLLDDPVTQGLLDDPPIAGRRFDDEEVTDDLVRAFMITGGRTRTDVPEVAIETIVCVRSEAAADRSGLRREEHRIVDALRGPMSVAEVSAHLAIPLRATVIIISELVAGGTVVAGRNADTGDTDFLMEIRHALQLL